MIREIKEFCEWVWQNYLRIRYNNAKEVYLVCHWAKFGVLPCKWSGRYVTYKFLDGTKERVPQIIDWTDGNGSFSMYYFSPIYHASTGATKMWSFSREEAELMARTLQAQTSDEITFEEGI